MVLDVLAVGQIGGVAAEFRGDLAEGAQLLDIQSAGVAADAHHEVFGLEQVDVLVTGQGAVVALFALGVEAPPAEAAAQIALVDAVETLLGVDVLDAGANVERVVVLLGLLVGVQRLAVTERPLALGATLAATGARALPGFGGAGEDGCGVVARSTSRWLLDLGVTRRRHSTS